MAIFLTGSTGYIGAHVAADLLEQHGVSLNLLVRARDPQEAASRLWRAMQLHLEFPRFYEYFQTRMRIFCGDLTAPHFGLSDDDYDRLIHTIKNCFSLRPAYVAESVIQAVQVFSGFRRQDDVTVVVARVR